VSFVKTDPIKASEYDRDVVHRWTAPLGYSIVRVIVRHRFGASLKWFGPRFGNHSYKPDRELLKLSWSNVDKDIVRVCGLRVLPKRGMTYSHRRFITDEVDVHFDHYVWTRNEPLEYHLLIHATRDWDGKMSFYSYLQNERRFGYARFRVRVKNEESDGVVLEEPNAKAMLKNPEWALAPGVDAEQP
jgi:hypothetical protein